jgi:hypothetical protein
VRLRPNRPAGFRAGENNGGSATHPGRHPFSARTRCAGIASCACPSGDVLVNFNSAIAHQFRAICDGSRTRLAPSCRRSRFNFMSEARIWYSRTPDQRALSSDFENVIALSDEFYHELVAHPIPYDLDAIKLLAASPAVLDLYMWLSYRCFKAKGKEMIPLFGDFGLSRQIGSVEYSRPGGSVECSSSGSRPFGRSGPSAQPASAQTDRACS